MMPRPEPLNVATRMWFLGAVAAGVLGTVLLDEERRNSILGDLSHSPVLLMILLVVQLGVWIGQVGKPLLSIPVFSAGVILTNLMLVLIGRDALSPALMAVMMLWVALMGSRQQVMAAGVFSLLSFVLVMFIYGEFADALSRILGVVAGGLVGELLRERNRAIEQLMAAQEQLKQQAEQQERQRIAREVHDVVGHTLTTTLLHIGGARMHLEKNPEKARAALLQAEALGRESMMELRRTVGLLGETGQTPLPGVADLSQLVDGFRHAGLQVEWNMTPLPAMPAAAELDLFRMVQEALTNASRHGTGKVCASLTCEDRQVHLRVENLPKPSPAKSGLALERGFGLKGLQERAQQRQGQVFHGLVNGLWILEVWFPVPAGSEVAS